MTTAPPRITADWLSRPETQAVFAALRARGHEARAVGGAVRNALIGKDVADIDIATPALPEQSLSAAKAAGLHVIPTGLQHGTVTVVSGHIPHEVTTLRRDVETDGRHAVVAFTDDWAADAARRDFTINALYCAADGTVHDPLGGYSDLVARRVRFIGDARARIGEDYLRILRFFRFTAEYVRDAPDAEGLAACGQMRDGLQRLSAERIRSEVLKIVAAPRGGDVADIMHAHGFWVPLLGLAAVPEHLRRLAVVERLQGRAPNAVTRLAALAILTSEDADHLASRLKMSTHEWMGLAAVGRLWRQISPDLDQAACRRMLHREGRAAVTAAGAVAWARHDATATDADWTGLMLELETLDVPTFPVRGRDVLDRGVAPGPMVGAILARLTEWWVARDFAADREVLLARLDVELAPTLSE
jgi:poly(A) polymerase